MTKPDPFEYDDAAYVLGALSEQERAAFEAHLATCEGCAARVGDITGAVEALGEITEQDLQSPEVHAPETLWPRLRRAAGLRSRRRVAILSTLAAVAAACVITLVLVLWPSSTPSSQPSRPFTALSATPLQASATLRQVKWGTVIDVHCRYLPGMGGQRSTYDLVVYDRQGHRFNNGNWRMPAYSEDEGNVEYATGTALDPHQIARLDITLPDGKPVLRLRV